MFNPREITIFKTPYYVHICHWLRLAKMSSYPIKLCCQIQWCGGGGDFNSHLSGVTSLVLNHLDKDSARAISGKLHFFKRNGRSVWKAANKWSQDRNLPAAEPTQSLEIWNTQVGQCQLSKESTQSLKILSSPLSPRPWHHPPDLESPEIDKSIVACPFLNKRKNLNFLVPSSTLGDKQSTELQKSCRKE